MTQTHSSHPLGVLAAVWRTKISGLLLVMPLLSYVGIMSLQACAELLVHALPAVMLYRSAGICCCVSTQALILKSEPRVDEFLSFKQRQCRGCCEAMPGENISCFVGM